MKTFVLIAFLFLSNFAYTQTIDATIKSMVVAEMNKWKMDSVTVWMNKVTMEGDGKTAATAYGPSEEYFANYVQAYVAKLFTEYTKVASYTATALKTYKPAVGTLVWNSTTKTFQRYTGTIWQTQ
jgi:hypothetical protein